MRTFVELKNGARVYGNLRSYYWNDGVLVLQFVGFTKSIRVQDTAQLWRAVIDKNIMEKMPFTRIKESKLSAEDNDIGEQLCFQLK